MNNRTVIIFVILGAVVALALMFFVLDLGNGGNINQIEIPDTATTTATSSDDSEVEELPSESLPPFESTLPPEIITPPAPVLRACYVGGCSGQLCTDDPDAASTCEYREEYMCYRTATCERQSSGQCGWTQSPQLSACLIKAQQNSYPQ
jgi:hypothetical protein